MANPYVNKVIVNDQIKLDLTGDTVTAETLMQGYTAHDASGAPIVGTASSGETSYLYAGDTEPSGGNNGDLWLDFTEGGGLPAGWCFGYCEATPESASSSVAFVFNGLNVDADNSIFVTWTEENKPQASSASTRIMVGRVAFGGFFTTQTVLQNVTSTGAAQASAQLADTEASVVVDKTGATPVTTVTVGYVNTRKFVVGKKYKAIMVGHTGV